VSVVAVLYLAREILIPLAFAVTLSLILAPAIAWLEKLRLGRVPAALLVMLMSMAGAGAIGWVIFNDLVDVANQLPQYQQNIHKKLEAIRAPNTGAVGRAPAGARRAPDGQQPRRTAHRPERGKRSPSGTGRGKARQRIAVRARHDSAVPGTPGSVRNGGDLQSVPHDRTQRLAGPALPSCGSESAQRHDAGTERRIG